MRAAAVATLRTLPRVALGVPPKFRRRLLVLLALATVLGAAYLLWFRDSSFVRVEKVTVTGLSNDQAPQIRAALTQAARGMTTLDVNDDALRRAVAGNPLVRSVSAVPQFPHGLRIDVVENVPRAWLVVAGRRVPVAGNGTILPEQTVDGSLPTIQIQGAGASGRVSDAATSSLVSVAAAAPTAIVHRLARISRQGGKGIVVQVRNGPVIWFGDASRLDAKWADAAAILADHGSQGAVYIDVHIPERPLAGGLHVDVSPPSQQPPAAAPAPAAPTGAAPQTAAPAQPAAPVAPTTQAAPAPTAPSPAQPAAPATTGGTGG